MRSEERRGSRGEGVWIRSNAAGLDRCGHGRVYELKLTRQIGWWGDMGGPKQKGIVTYGEQTRIFSSRS